MTRVYLDACCFIEMLKEERKLPLDHPEDADMTKRLLNASRDGKIEVWTSMMTVAEVLRVDRMQEPDEALKNRIERLLLSGKDGVQVHGMSPFVAIRARDLYWNEGFSEKAADRIHVATALDLGCDEMLSVDGRLKKKFDRSKIGQCDLRAVRDTRNLPGEYRQNSLFEPQ
ncbi:type II toxin-antitoxin system VapC family toxin [Devosia sp. A449]